MPLRCLLFSSNKGMIQPIWQVLPALGIEGEYCASGVDAVERVTTQMFQIVITDWNDQPEAAFLLKTARDLKAAQRPLTLAIVGDDARLPEALQAGANSVLVQPIRLEQVHDTLSTACELLRARQQPAAQKPTAYHAAAYQQGAHPAGHDPSAQPAEETANFPTNATMAATASAAAGSAPASLPRAVTRMPEVAFRAGEFLQTATSKPGAQFDTERESDVEKSLEQAALAEVDALTDLAPTAAAVPQVPPAPAEPEAPQEPLTGWAALQARLTRKAPLSERQPQNELLSYSDTAGEVASHDSHSAASAPEIAEAPSASDPQPESEAEAALFDYMSGEQAETEAAQEPRSKRGWMVLATIFAVCLVLVAMPQTRGYLQVLSHSALQATGNWLNPPAVPLPQAQAQHENFGQPDDEYKLPTPTNIPDATTDPSQIRVVPVIDPTAKPDKNADANGQTQAPTVANSPTDTTQPAAASQPAQNQTPPAQTVPTQAAPVQNAAAGDTLANLGTVSAPGTGAPAQTLAAPATPVPSTSPGAQSGTVVTPAASPQLRPAMASAQPTSAPHTVAVASNTAIPQSLRSQLASSIPDASGAMPPEAAMSSIEPVQVADSALELASTPVEPEYPAAAKDSGQRGSVVLQVLIGRDGTVQDAKFLQGSLLFARAAIDAVKQWHFKPYYLNKRPVSVQTAITLNFKPPA